MKAIVKSHQMMVKFKKMFGPGTISKLLFLNGPFLLIWHVVVYIGLEKCIFEEIKLNCLLLVHIMFLSMPCQENKFLVKKSIANWNKWASYTFSLALCIVYNTGKRFYGKHHFGILAFYPTKVIKSQFRIP